MPFIDETPVEELAPLKERKLTPNEVRPIPLETEKPQQDVPELRQALKNTGIQTTPEGIMGNINHGQNYVGGADVGALDATYLNISTGKVHPTNAATAGTVETFIGFPQLNQPIFSGENGFIQEGGTVAGFSGLTIGQRYRAADVGSSDSDVTQATSAGSITLKNAEGSSAFAAANISGAAYPFTVTKKSKVTSVTTTANKENSPTDNFVCRIVRSAAGVSGARFYPQRSAVVASVSVASSSLSASAATVTFTFGGIVLMPGTYMVLFSRSADDNTNYITIAGNGTASTGVYNHNPSAGWVAGGYPVVTINYVNETFAAGDITDYFYTIRQEVGIATTATDILIQTVSPQKTFTASASGNTSSSGDETPSVTVETITPDFLPRFIHVNATITLRGVNGTVHGIFDVDAGTWQGNVNHASVTATINGDIQLGVMDSGGASEGYAYMGIGSMNDTSFVLTTIGANFTGANSYGITGIAIKCIR